MTTTVEKAIKMLSSTVNVSTGLLHPNDMNKARELFSILHRKGELLTKSEVSQAAISNGWSSENADELGSIAQQIGEGKSARVVDGPWWKSDIYEQILAR